MARLAAAPVVLASASRARAALLEAAGLEVTIAPASIDEDEIKQAFRAAGEGAAACATALAEAKAARAARRHPGRLVIGADQMLECDGDWLDKPADAAQARMHLQALRGRTHVLVSAACVARDGAVLWHATDRAALTMRRFSDAFLDRYLDAAGEAVLHSVGAYHLEGLGAQLFSRIEGDYFTILGLPLLPLLEFLRGHGVVPA